MLSFEKFYENKICKLEKVKFTKRQTRTLVVWTDSRSLLKKKNEVGWSFIVKRTLRLDCLKKTCMHTCIIVKTGLQEKLEVNGMLMPPHLKYNEAKRREIC